MTYWNKEWFFLSVASAPKVRLLLVLAFLSWYQKHLALKTPGFSMMKILFMQLGSWQFEPCSASRLTYSLMTKGNKKDTCAQIFCEEFWCKRFLMWVMKSYL